MCSQRWVVVIHHLKSAGVEQWFGFRTLWSPWLLHQWQDLFSRAKKSQKSHVTFGVFQCRISSPVLHPLPCPYRTAVKKPERQEGNCLSKGAQPGRLSADNSRKRFGAIILIGFLIGLVTKRQGRDCLEIVPECPSALSCFHLH